MIEEQVCGICGGSLIKIPRTTSNKYLAIYVCSGDTGVSCDGDAYNLGRHLVRKR